MKNLVSSIVELFVSAVAISIVALLILPEWRKNPQYIFAGWVFGPLCGYIVLRLGWNPGLAVLAASVTAITAPATVAWLHGKSAKDVAEDLLNLRKKNDN